MCGRIWSAAMTPRMQEAAKRVLGLTAVVGSLVLTTFACPAQSISKREIAGETSRAAQASNQRLAAAQQQLVLVDERIARLSAEESAKLTSFVVGNLYFVLAHELGHAVISQLNLPVLGREEDAADSFATLSMLLIGTKLSDTVLREAVRGLWVTAQRDKSDDQLPALYDEHSLDLQRAFQIVCLMVGANPKTFRDFATIAKMPSQRQETCAFDFKRAAHSWESLLADRSHVASRPRSFFKRSLVRKGTADIRSRLRVKYVEPDSTSGYRSVLKAAGVLETVARFGREVLSLPRPITIKAIKCDEPNAYWDDQEREIVVCFELVGEFIELGLRSSTND
jgi:Putative metallopeptidase